MRNLGMIRVVAASPKIKVANVAYNVEEIIRCMEKANAKDVGVILFPEMSITGYSCGDLLYQQHLYEENLNGLNKIAEATKDMSVAAIVGFYLRLRGNLYNCGALVQNGVVKGIVPKTFLPNYKEFSEGRWFASGGDIIEDVTNVKLFGYDIPFGNLVFRDNDADFGIGIEICEDMWVSNTPGSHLVLNGADIIFNPSASNETIGKASYRRDLIAKKTSESSCGYVYASAGACESTTDCVFSGHTVIAENGEVLAEGERFKLDTVMLVADIDYESIQFKRCHGQNAARSRTIYKDTVDYRSIELEPLKLVKENMKLHRPYSKNPFMPKGEAAIADMCSEIFGIQTTALARRVEHTYSKKCVIGISGGLDSTLAVLVAVKAMKLLGRPASDVVAVTMPGFGTTGKTYNNALTLMKLLGTDVREISIKEAVLQHFQDIGHDASCHDVTYENSQARERTQILMDLANKEGGLVVGTGDMSEMALGWCTYNGDHMSMYGVNAGVPKTVVQHVVKWINNYVLSGENEDKEFSQDNAQLKQILQDILDTPISPELIPPDEDGNIAQKTEDNVGPYPLHDFFIYHTLSYGTSPRKLLHVASQVFEDEYDSEFIRKWLKVFYRRFFNQQFKRNCVPDGPKIGTVGLSPRGDWRMPSDADSSIWLADLE